MTALADRRVAIMILITGVLLLFSTIATLVAVVKATGEIEKNRRFDCIARDINNFENPPGCEEYLR